MFQPLKSSGGVNQPSPHLPSSPSWHLWLHLCFQVVRRVGVTSLQEALPGRTFFDLPELMKMAARTANPHFIRWVVGSIDDIRCICINAFICIYIYTYMDTMIYPLATTMAMEDPAFVHNFLACFLFESLIVPSFPCFAGKNQIKTRKPSARDHPQQCCKDS